jgi:hypothetical protein
VAKWAALLGTLAVLGYVSALEASQSYLQSLFVSQAVEDMHFEAMAGPSPAVVFPEAGHWRLGYVGLPSFIRRLTTQGFRIDRQARQSPALQEFMAAGGYAVYREKSQAGLVLRDRLGALLESGQYPSVAYRSFAEIPSALVDTLRFIEDRDLLDPTRPYRNPAVEWRRFLLAAAGRWAACSIPALGAAAPALWRRRSRNFGTPPAGRTCRKLGPLRAL